MSVQANFVKDSLEWIQVPAIAFIRNCNQLQALIPADAPLTQQKSDIRPGSTGEVAANPRSDGRKQKKRDRLDLMMEVLQSTKEPVRKTRLLYQTAMNHEQLSRYLEILLSHGMIEKTGRPHESYVITENGRTLLTLFDISPSDI
jgi:predicted transcriptional regulator